MAEFKLRTNHKDYAVSEIEYLKGSRVYLVSHDKAAGMPLRVNPENHSNVYAGGGLDRSAQWKCHVIDRKMTWNGKKEPVMAFKNVACGSFLAIKNGMVTTTCSSTCDHDHCEFITTNVDGCITLRKAMNPFIEGVGCKPSGQMKEVNNVPYGPGPAGAPGKFFIFDADIVQANEGLVGDCFRLDSKLFRQVSLEAKSHHLISRVNRTDHTQNP